MTKRGTNAKNRTGFSGEVRDALQQQLEAFRARFGRDPDPDDPVFFDPQCEIPLALDVDEFQRDVISAMHRARVSPELIYAYLRTGLIVTRENQRYLSAKDRDDWNRAIVEYSRQGPGDPR
jgi:hypothetical protein